MRNRFGFILVKPQLGENIGASARALKNFGFSNLSIVKPRDAWPNIKAKASAGILEWMYGGYGGEIVYFPDNKHWALGIDAYWVKQREFDQKFSFRDYETVTGLITAYYDIPFYVQQAMASGGPVLELGCGTGRVSLPIARTGIEVLGLDISPDDRACQGEDGRSTS